MDPNSVGSHHIVYDTGEYVQSITQVTSKWLLVEKWGNLMFARSKMMALDGDLETRQKKIKKYIKLLRD